MIEEAYVSYDIARRLKEKGFNEKCIAQYNNKEEFEIETCLRTNEEWEQFWLKGIISAPTQQMAMRWLREEKGIFIEINKTKAGTYFFSIWDGNIDRGLNDVEFETYELAVAFGLLFVLTKMDI